MDPVVKPEGVDPRWHLTSDTPPRERPQARWEAAGIKAPPTKSEACRSALSALLTKAGHRARRKDLWKVSTKTMWLLADTGLARVVGDGTDDEWELTEAGVQTAEGFSCLG